MFIGHPYTHALIPAPFSCHAVWHSQMEYWNDSLLQIHKPYRFTARSMTSFIYKPAEGTGL